MGMGAAKPGQTIQGKGTGTVQPSTPTLAQPGQVSTIPAQGGKGGVPSNVPGYAQPYVNALPPQQPPQMGLGMGGVAGKGNAPVQPTIPPQGGKAPLTPEQHAAISANADPARGLGLNLGDMLYGGGGQQPQVQPQVQQPAPVMPRPVMTRPAMLRPTMTRPSLIGSGLAGLRGRR
jgi:hypothetical protein